jgi:SAM-dependent methyltransferase
MNQAIECLVCKHGSPVLFLELGSTALANRFLAEDQLASPEPVYPLRVGRCEKCGHVQLLDRIPPSAMFDDYLYMSSASETLKRHFDELSRMLVGRLALGSGDLVVDIGCNDGTLLDSFRRNSQGNVSVLGVDPARNLAEQSSVLGIPRVTALFTSETARFIKSQWGEAALITATNTFPHIQDLHDFMTGIRTLLRPGGVFVAEMHYFGDLLEQVAFDTVYHEHVSYWLLGPLQHLMAQHQMEVTDAERLPIHHGQLRVFCQRRGEGQVSKAVGKLGEHEKACGFHDFETYRNLASKVEGIKRDLTRTLSNITGRGKKIAAYGAPAKGNTLLTYFDLGPDKLDYIVDRSPLKQGRYSPGMHIPVVAPSRLLSDRPDYVLLLAWNFQEEILEQQSEYRRLGGQFIIPLPEVRII